jgi:hypothetical protein
MSMVWKVLLGYTASGPGLGVPVPRPIHINKKKNTNNTPSFLLKYCIAPFWCVSVTLLRVTGGYGCFLGSICIINILNVDM